VSRRYPVSDAAMMRLIEGIVRARAPTDLRVATALQDRHLSDEQRETLRELLSDELVETGLGPDDEPNERGRLIEAAIDWLGHR
jgi:hypothetical protein